MLYSDCEFLATNSKCITFFQSPMMFSYTKSFMGKRKVSLQIEESQWSDKFTLDTIEDADKVTCKSGKNAENYHVGVQINMSKSSLTKIITFTPFYLLHNTMDYAIEICELEQLDPNWLEIGKNFVFQHTVHYAPEIFKM